MTPPSNMDIEEKLIKSIDTKLTARDIAIDDYNIHYVTAGSGPPLLLIHGATIGWGQWYPNIAEFAKYFKVYALDLPGSGYSTKIDFRKANLEKSFVDVVQKFIAKKNLVNTSIIGHSIGGWVAIKLALRDKSLVNKMVLVNSLGFSDYVSLPQRLIGAYPIAKILASTVMKPSRKNMKKFLSDVLYDPSSQALTEEFVDYFHHGVSQSKSSHPLLFINGMLRNFKMREELTLIEDLSKVNNPTLIIIGANDPVIPVNKSRQAFGFIPHARVETFLNTGHVPSIERSDKFNALVTKFLTYTRM